MASTREYVFALRFLIPGIISILCGLLFLFSPNDKLMGLGAIALGIVCTAIGVWLLKMIRANDNPTTTPPPSMPLQNTPQQRSQNQVPQLGVPQTSTPPKRAAPLPPAPMQKPPMQAPPTKK
jgi:hypothetical protein